jgi:shikimate dehydrogenase
MADGSAGFLRLGLIGWPLGTSLSPLVHRAFMADTGTAGEYRLYPVEPADLEGQIRMLAEAGVHGLNVTFPHKRAAAVLCNRLDGDAETTGVVNTLSFMPDGIVGGNTDAGGFRRMIPVLRLSGPFLLAGGGGAALAVALALGDMGFEYRVFCRDPGRWRGAAHAERMELLNAAASGLRAGVVVNATTLGWKDGDLFPVETGSMEGLAFLDLNYNPRWRWRNELAGTASSIDTGETMLVFQAAESFRLWTGLTPPVGAASAAASAWVATGGGAGV